MICKQLQILFQYVINVYVLLFRLEPIKLGAFKQEKNQALTNVFHRPSHNKDILEKVSIKMLEVNFSDNQSIIVNR